MQNLYWENMKKQAATKLCQAQSKLIQMGRVVRKTFEVKKIFGQPNFGVENFLSLQTFLV